MIATRRIATFVVTALLAQAAASAPLCRDTKGLFTPCPHAANRTARAILTSAPAQEPGLFLRETAMGRRSNPALAGGGTRRARLCTDSKGLFTPCAR